MDFQLPELGEGIYEAELVQWLVKPGDQVKHGQSLAEVMTDKATMEVPSPFTGTISALQVEDGKSMNIGDVILTYDVDSATTKKRKGKSKAKSEGKQPKKQRQAKSSNGDLKTATTTAVNVRAAPSVRRMARQLGVDLVQVRGSGPGGRVLIDDVAGHVQTNQPATKPAADSTSKPLLPSFKPGTRIKLQGLRRKIAEQMVRSKQTIPHYSYIDECDVTELVRLRDSLKDTLAESGVKLTYLAFIVKAVTAALREVPIVNATLDKDANEIVLHDQYHIGIAVATPSGLIVPVIRDADQKDVKQLSREIEQLSNEARAGKSRLEDLRGGTFTITSIGGIGGLVSTPVINHPEAAILGIGKIVKRPVYDDSENLRPADMMYLSFSFDHRILDGDIGAQFSNAIIRRLENPAVLLLPDDPSR